MTRKFQRLYVKVLLERLLKLTDARLCEELECLLGASEDIPLMVSLLRALGLIICRPVNIPVQ